MNAQFNALSALKIVACTVLALLATANRASAADIVFLSDSALQSAMEELIPEFEKASGHHVKVAYATPGANTERVRKGEPADVAIVLPEQWDSLQKDRKLGSRSRVVIARVGIGIFVKKGVARPDIGSVDAVKRALLGANSIAVGDPSQSAVGSYVVPLLDRLGIGRDIKPKLRLTDGVAAAIQAVVKGDADIGFAEMTEIVGSPDVSAAGPLPPSIQNLTTFLAAIPPGANQAAAEALVDFLLSQRAVAVLRARGLECGPGEANDGPPLSCILGPPGEGLKLMTGRGLRQPK